MEKLHAKASSRGAVPGGAPPAPPGAGSLGGGAVGLMVRLAWLSGRWRGTCGARVMSSAASASGVPLPAAGLGIDRPSRVPGRSAGRRSCGRRTHGLASHGWPPAHRGRVHRPAARRRDFGAPVLARQRVHRAALSHGRASAAGSATAMPDARIRPWPGAPRRGIRGGRRDRRPDDRRNRAQVAASWNPGVERERAVSSSSISASIPSNSGVVR